MGAPLHRPLGDASAATQRYRTPEGRAIVLDAPPASPTVTLAMDRRTFARLAGGRWSGDTARTQGVVRIGGDQELGNRIVDNMAFTL